AGDENNPASSVNLTYFVFTNHTALSLASSLNDSYYTEDATLTATVSTSETPVTGPPTGWVEFYDGDDYLGETQLSGGVATFVASDLSAGDHDITAVYQGDDTFVAGSSDGLIQTVLINGTAVSLTSSLNSSYLSEDVTFTATVSASGTPVSGPPTGWV